jgi:hypothetical protein
LFLSNLEEWDKRSIFFERISTTTLIAIKILQIKGGKAGVTISATSGRQISGNRRENVSNGGQIAEDNGHQLTENDGELEIEDGNLTEDNDL